MRTLALVPCLCCLMLAACGPSMNPVRQHVFSSVDELAEAVQEGSTIRHAVIKGFNEADTSRLGSLEHLVVVELREVVFTNAESLAWLGDARVRELTFWNCDGVSVELLRTVFTGTTVEHCVIAGQGAPSFSRNEVESILQHATKGASFEVQKEDGTKVWSSR